MPPSERKSAQKLLQDFPLGAFPIQTQDGQASTPTPTAGPSAPVTVKPHLRFQALEYLAFPEVLETAYSTTKPFFFFLFLLQIAFLFPQNLRKLLKSVWKTLEDKVAGALQNARLV